MLKVLLDEEGRLTDEARKWIAEEEKKWLKRGAPYHSLEDEMAEYRFEASLGLGPAPLVESEVPVSGYYGWHLPR